LDLFSNMAQREETLEAPRKPTVRKSPVDHWPLVVLLERAAYLRKLAALGDGAASDTLKESPEYSATLFVRSRSGDPETHANFAVMFHILDGRATLASGRAAASAEPIATVGSSIDGAARYELRAGDVVHIPAGQPHRILVAGDKSVTYLAVKTQVAL
jgi:mannose-6-phosphate isomerase-like protein (cupin superfamily)